jgi:hypothetical protein
MRSPLLCVPNVHFAGAAVTHVQCRDISDTNKRLFFEEAYARAQQKAERNSSDRRALQQAFAKQLKRGADGVSVDLPWLEAKEQLLDAGFGVIKKLAPVDAEHVRLLTLLVACTKVCVQSVIVTAADVSAW